MVIVRQRKAEHFKDYFTFSASLLDDCGFLLPGANFRELDIFSSIYFLMFYLLRKNPMLKMFMLVR